MRLEIELESAGDAKRARLVVEGDMGPATEAARQALYVAALGFADAISKATEIFLHTLPKEAQCRSSNPRPESCSTPTD